jgi:hypothetical protein
MAPMATIYRDWSELPFREIWAVDAEYYPGAGLANGATLGDAVTPLCLVALEMRSGRLVRLWQNQLGWFPPYRLDNEALIISYNLAAEFGFHIAQHWGEPACAIDAYLEFRHLVNDGAIKSGDREKGFHSIDGALRYFLEDGIGYAHDKEAARARILQGPPFDPVTQQQVQDYCEDDARKLARLVRRIVPTIRSLPHAMFRAKVQWSIAQQERRGVPINLPLFSHTKRHWQGMRAGLVDELDEPFRCYETVDGVPHWRRERFADYIRRNNMSWRKLDSGQLAEDDDTFKEMAGLYPQIEQLRELRYSLSKLKLNDLAVGTDGRNRTPLWAYGTKTGRCAPSTSAYIFGPAKWLRHYITPPPGRVLVHRDYQQQEVRIIAILSGDDALLQACEGDVYLGIAGQLGFLRDSMDDDERRAIRTLFKTVVLGIVYGLGARSLATRAGISRYEAREILARLRAKFHRFEDFCRSVLDHAGLNLEIGTCFGWIMQCPSGINPRTVRNFPSQSAGAEILHALCVLAERRDIEIVGPIHDAVLVEGPLKEAEELSRALDQAMGDASAIVLRGYRLPTDHQIIKPGEHYVDDRGAAMWKVVTRLLTKLEKETA